MKWNRTLKLYRISADNGQSWTEQWITDDEAKWMSDEYSFIVSKIMPRNTKIYY